MITFYSYTSLYYPRGVGRQLSLVAIVPISWGTDGPGSVSQPRIVEFHLGSLAHELGFRIVIHYVREVSQLHSNEELVWLTIAILLISLGL